ncbi:GAF domain-containing protein [Gordonia neofelifaecis]|uniref:GAF domain-containing protein n=1 Tax=Gordonia neofelifaecis NRRL B-59395 TaxID=644548 RepID=F1YP78_9ACTN|nr:GAF domain-containing protein [Gordonia neofelifaecis]EGD53473.1 GAF domain-containing protein [Gordonia neofelifaecis NRRL B-59395]
MGEGTTVSTRVRRAYEQFLAGVAPADDTVRSLVRESWERSRSRGVDPADLEPGHDGAPMSGTEFDAYRSTHRLAAIRPLVQSLIVDDIADAGVVVALTDNQGRLLWVEGDHSARDAAARINFVEGSVWSEDTVGTNAPGLALTMNRGVQIIGPEHFSGPVQNWNCAAAPVHDPVSGELLGVIDVTGGPAAAAPFALAAVRSVVAAVERELNSRAVDLSVPETFGALARPQLTVLADGPARWRDGPGAARPLSPRHAEILLLLQSYPEGLGTEQLATMLSDEGLGAVTVRAEISRLRRDLGDVVAARPYRLTVETRSDVDDLRGLIEAGELTSAVRTLGRGGLLAESLAPGVVELLDEVREDLRSRMFGTGDLAALSAWVASPHGRDDITAWNALAHRLPAGHPQRSVAEGRVRLLDRRFGVQR